jgi:hypothetical protein
VQPGSPEPPAALADVVITSPGLAQIGLDKRRLADAPIQLLGGRGERPNVSPSARKAFRGSRTPV